MSTSTGNPRVSALLQAVTGIEVLVLVGAGGGLLLQPAVLGEIWPWRLTPFNAAFLGAVYSASLVTAAMVVLFGRWSPARVVVPMILLFTTIVLVISLVYLDRFRLDNPATWLWFLLYVGIPLNAAWHAWLYRHWPPVGRAPLGAGLRAVLLAEAIAFGLYGLGLLAFPAWFGAFWPWPIDAFHARLYSVAFMTPALGMWLLTRSAARAEVLAVALGVGVGGLLSIVAFVATDMRVARIDWSRIGTWAWIAMFAVMTVTGAWLWRTARALPRPAGPANEAALVVPVPAMALLAGVAFVSAGIAGFLPFFTPPAAHSAHALSVTAAYGHLLGLFPVNAVHSVFHLVIGLLGIGAFFQPGRALTYMRGFAVALATLTVMGLLPGFNVVFGLAPLFSHDVWLHGVEAVAAGYIGFVQPVVAADSSMRLADSAAR